MKVKYENDPGAGAGYGRLIFSEIKIPPSPWSYSLQRAADQKYAANVAGSPWAEQKSFIESEGVLTENGNLTLFLSPVTVDALSRKDAYRVTLKGADNIETAAPLRITDIIYSTDKNLLTPESSKSETVKKPEQIYQEMEKPGVGHDLLADVAKPEKTGQIQNQPGQQRQKIPQDESCGEKTSVNGNRQPETRGGSGRENANLSEKRKKFTPLLPVLFIAFAVITAYLFFNKQERASTDSSIPTPVRESESQKNALSVEESVNKFFADKDRSPERAMELAGKLNKETTAEKDAVFRLYYFASEGGNPQGIMAYAACYDPSLPSWGTIQKDGELALRLYGKAAEENAPGAAEALDSLLRWLKDNAGKNNGKAEK